MAHTRESVVLGATLVATIAVVAICQISSLVDSKRQIQHALEVFGIPVLSGDVSDQIWPELAMGNKIRQPDHSPEGLPGRLVSRQKSMRCAINAGRDSRLNPPRRGQRHCRRTNCRCCLRGCFFRDAKALAALLVEPRQQSTCGRPKTLK